MGTPPPFSSTSTLANQADHWLSLMRSGRASSQEYAAFRAWRDADPAHRQAWLNLTSHVDGPGFEQFHAGADTANARPRRALGRRRFLWGAAGLAVVGGSAFASNLVHPWRNRLSDVSTGVGERRRLTLADGSRVLLDACSALDLNFTPSLRQLTLHDGAVMVSTSEDPRPFVILTQEGMIRSEGASYMVRQHPFRTLVVAHDRPVHVQNRAGARLLLAPGTGMRFDHTRLGEFSKDLASRAAWTDGRIVARGVTLSEVVEALRPYYLGSLRVTTSAGGLPVVGDYSLDDIDGTLRSLERELPIALKRYTPWITSISVSAS